jgi:hypothetical protein
VIALCWEVDPLQGIIKDVRRWLRIAGHPQMRRELLHYFPNFGEISFYEVGQTGAEEGPELLEAQTLSASAVGSSLA